MQPGLLTRKAFRTFYGSNRLIILSDPVAAAIDAATLGSVDILLLGPEGILRTDAESAKDQADPLAAVGAPLGVCGIIVDPATAKAAKSWAKWFEAQTGRSAPKMHQLGKRPNAAAVFGAVTECMILDAERSRSSAAGTERDLTVLRRDFERALINLEKARRVIRGVGYDTRYSTLSVPLGTTDVGPEPGTATSPLAPFSLSYEMPADAAGLVGVSLHFVVPDSDHASGVLRVSLTRATDRHLLGSASVAFDDLAGGWAYFEFERTMQRSFGDADLHIDWQVDGPGDVPRVSLSDVPETADGAGGEGSGALPAMKIWSGFAPGELADDSILTPVALQFRRSGFAALMDVAEPLWPLSDEGDSPLEVEDPWVQTHVQADGPIGFSYADLIAATTQSISVSIETAHEAAPACLYLVAAGRMPEKEAAGALEGVLDRATAGNGPLTDFDAATKLAWTACVLPAGEAGSLDLSIPEELQSEGPLNLYTAVVSPTGEHAYGWCRWHHVTAYVAPGRVRAAGHAQQLPSVSQRMRSVKFPEVGERLEFLAGTARLHKLTADLGFSPMIVAEDNGSLQTHPLLEDISAALYRAGATAGTTRVACDVETAHERSPEFQYVLALMPSKTTEKYKYFKEFLAQLPTSGARSYRGFDEKTGVHYCVRQLAALEVASLAIDLDEPLGGDYDIIAAALPVHNIVSYGWCRWMSLSISSTVENEPIFPLSAPPA